MTDTAKTPGTPNVAEIVSFLRRFAGLMSNGDSAAQLQRASDLLESLTARLIAASDEENLLRYKHETLTQHADALEAECETLKNDIEGHLDITSSVLAERDALGATLKARETELAELRDGLTRERDERVARSQAHEQALTSLREAFDERRAALQATLEARGDECDQLRRALDREREDGAARSAALEGELSELRLAFDRERGELQAQLKARGDELAAFRAASERELDVLKEKVAFLEARRAELRSTFDRIGDLGNQTLGPHDRADAAMSGKPLRDTEANPPAQRGDRAFAVGEADAVVPKATLRQARDQFEYLARQFIPLGDIASQVMCELGAYTLDLVLVTGQQTDDLPVGEVARSILAPIGSSQVANRV